MQLSKILPECEIFVRIHCFNSRDSVITEMLQVGCSLHFDSISTYKERPTNTFPGYHSGYHNLFRKFVSFAVQAFRLQIFFGNIELNSIVLAISWYLKEKSFSSWKTSRGEEWMEKHWRSYPARSTLLLRHAEFILGVFKRLQQCRFFSLTKWWTDDLLINIRGTICLMELWVPRSSSCEQTSSSKISAFFSVVAVTGRLLPLRCSVDPVSSIFLIKLWTARREHSKLGCSFQILYAFQPF